MNLELPDDVLEAVAVRVAESVLERLGPGEAEGEFEPWRLMSVEETAAALERSRAGSGRARRGDLTPRPFGLGSWRFDPDDVRAFARSRRVPANDDEGGR